MSSHRLQEILQCIRTVLLYLSDLIVCVWDALLHSSQGTYYIYISIGCKYHDMQASSSITVTSTCQLSSFPLRRSFLPLVSSSLLLSIILRLKTFPSISTPYPITNLRRSRVSSSPNKPLRKASQSPCALLLLLDLLWQLRALFSSGQQRNTSFRQHTYLNRPIKASIISPTSK